MSGSPRRRAKGPTPVVRDWIRFIRFAAKSDHVRLVESDLVRLAGLLSVVGTVHEHPEVLKAFRVLFIHPKRLPQWPSAIATIPATAEAIHRISRCTRAFQAQCEPRDSIQRVYLNLVEVLLVMVEIPDPEPFVAWAVATGIKHPGGVFHSNTLEHAAGKLRGVLGTLADPAYTNQVKGIEVVSC